MNKDLFREEIEHIEREIETIKRLDEVNNRLKQYNWVFLHPYVQGGDIERLGKILDNSNEPENEILDLFARKFLDLRTTIHFIDGYFRVRPFLKDHIQAIEESAIQCLQKDFRGAISVLLPVIESTLRKCLVEKKGQHKNTEIDISELLQAFRILGDEYIELQKKYTKIRHEHIVKSGHYLDGNQEKRLMKKQREYFDLWVKQLKDYLEHSLYLNTKENTVIDNFNRHLIFHALDDKIEYTFANYLRLFNCLHFLSWAIGNTTEGSSVFSVANEVAVENKYFDFMNILIASEALSITKANIYNAPPISFIPYLHPKYERAINRPVNEIRRILERLESLKNKQ